MNSPRGESRPGVMSTPPKVIRRPCDSTSGKWNKKSVRQKSRGVYLAIRLSFFELYDDILLMLSVRRLCVVVDSLIKAAKLCDCVISAWC